MSKSNRLILAAILAVFMYGIGERYVYQDQPSDGTEPTITLCGHGAECE